MGAYASSKRALNALSLTARAELAKDNITVSVVYPYITESDFYRNALTAPGRAPGHVQVRGGMPPADTGTTWLKKSWKRSKAARRRSTPTTG